MQVVSKGFSPLNTPHNPKRDFLSLGVGKQGDLVLALHVFSKIRL